MRKSALWGGLALSLLISTSLAAAQPSKVTFVIDMREEIAAKRFDLAKDVVGVRGGTDPLSWEQTLPARDAEGDGRYDEPPPPIQPVLTGTIRRHQAFTSQFLGPRDVVVYLPPGYDKETSRRFPVLYMQDGQNVFDDSSAGMEWQMDEIAERLIASGQIEPVIIVGVYNTEARDDEYPPTYVEQRRPDGAVHKRGGKADLYGRLLIEELKPFIDRTYRTRPDARSTGLGGASHGGLMEQEGGHHDEISWASRVEPMLRFLYGKE